MITNATTIRVLKEAKNKIQKDTWVEIKTGIGEGKLFKVDSVAMSGMNIPVAYFREWNTPVPLSNLRIYVAKK